MGVLLILELQRHEKCGMKADEGEEEEPPDNQDAL